jgi:putative aldouronate transport system substrate-binding protein
MKPGIKRMTFLVLIAALVLLAACSTKNNEGNPSDEPSSSPSASSASPAETATASASGEEAVDPLGKYDPPITIRATGSKVSQDLLTEGDTIENSVWTRGYEQELGIKVTYDWIVENPADVTEKMNVTLASGDLPDLLVVDLQQFAQLKKADRLADLTEYYDKYGSELLKSMYIANDGAGLKPVTSNGKLYALTLFGGSYDTSPMVWIRQDWLKNLNLSEPKTMQDLLAIAEAFTTKDPDGNKKNDTRGLILSKDLQMKFHPSIIGLANGYNAYPHNWIKDASGNIVYGSIQPEVKTALAVLQDLYQKGIIDPEFSVKDEGKAYEMVNAGKAGMFFGLHYNPFQVQELVKKDAKVDWKAYPIPTVDGSPAKVINQASVGTIFAVRKDYGNPEALIKLLNFQVDKMYGPNAAAERPKYLGKTEQGWHLAVVKQLPPNKNVAAQQNIAKAFESGDLSQLNTEEKGYYDGIMKYRGGDRESWWYERIFGPESSQGVIANYVDNNLIIFDEFSYAPTPTMISRKATLEKLELETFTKIIYGSAPVDDFDKFVEQWKKLGGDDITKEVNEAAK